MTATATHHAATTPARLPSNRRAPAAAGLFVGAWIVGLAAFPAGPALDASTEEVARFYAQHGAASGVQSIVVHGLAPIALAGVFLTVATASRAGRVVRAAGFTGVALAFIQLAAGIARSTAAQEKSASTTDALFDAVNRVDGLKMLAFAVMITATMAVLRERQALGRLLTITSATAVAALMVSAVGYLLLSPALGLAAYVSLPLLLLWTGATAAVARRRVA